MNNNIEKACYCQACESYFDYTGYPESGYIFEGMDIGICPDCLKKEDPELLMDLAIEFIKDLYIITPQSF